MTGDLSLQTIRGTDTNSLLRWYDQAKEALKRSSTPQERARADRAVQRLAEELRKRDVRL
jgi:hypothetical protein